MRVRAEAEATRVAGCGASSRPRRPFARWSVYHVTRKRTLVPERESATRVTGSDGSRRASCETRSRSAG